jgi:hypothetical protein
MKIDLSDTMNIILIKGIGIEIFILLKHYLWTNTRFLTRLHPPLHWG